jgi:hypothetical protein
LLEKEIGLPLIERTKRDDYAAIRDGVAALRGFSRHLLARPRLPAGLPGSAQPSEQGRFLIGKARQHLESVDGVIRDLRQAFRHASKQERNPWGCSTALELTTRRIKIDATPSNVLDDRHAGTISEPPDQKHAEEPEDDLPNPQGGRPQRRLTIRENRLAEKAVAKDGART